MKCLRKPPCNVWFISSWICYNSVMQSVYCAYLGCCLIRAAETANVECSVVHHLGQLDKHVNLWKSWQNCGTNVVHGFDACALRSDQQCLAPPVVNIKISYWGFQMGLSSILAHDRTRAIIPCAARWQSKKTSTGGQITDLMNGILNTTCMLITIM